MTKPTVGVSCWNFNLALRLSESIIELIKFALCFALANFENLLYYRTTDETTPHSNLCVQMRGVAGPRPFAAMARSGSGAGDGAGDGLPPPPSNNAVVEQFDLRGGT